MRAAAARKGHKEHDEDNNDSSTTTAALMSATTTPAAAAAAAGTSTSPHANNSTLKNLYLLGRIPFTFEAPLWCLLGTVLYHTRHHDASGTATLLSVGLVFLTNVSINYANEYFDYEADAIFAARADEHASHGGSKLLVSGVLPRWSALACAAAVQAIILVCIALSRTIEAERSSLQGMVLHFGVLAMIAAQQYVGPPLRIHYNGGGEVISSFEISAGPVLYGYLSQHTAHLQRGLTWREGWQTLGDGNMRLFCAWAWCFEMGRIFMMHAADIMEDRVAHKHTLVSMVGHAKTKVLYQATCAVACILAANLVAAHPAAAYLMLPMLLYSVPIAVRVQRGLDALIQDEEVGRQVFSPVPALVSLQSMATPALFIVITLVVGNCLE